MAYTALVDYYGLRCQIEFNFRDAKQCWGLEDFVHITPTGVTNAANLSLFMVNVAYQLRADVHAPDPDYSVLDLKADCRGAKYVGKRYKCFRKNLSPFYWRRFSTTLLAWAVFMSLNPPPASYNWRRYCFYEAVDNLIEFSASITTSATGATQPDTRSLERLLPPRLWIAAVRAAWLRVTCWV